MILEIVLPPELREWLENDDDLSLAWITLERHGSEGREKVVEVVLYDRRQGRYDRWNPPEDYGELTIQIT